MTVQPQIRDRAAQGPSLLQLPVMGASRSLQYQGKDVVVLPQHAFLASKKFTSQGFPNPEALSLYLIALDMFFSFVIY